jgi:DNA-binding MarR family transcriptional regulator
MELYLLGHRLMQIAEGALPNGRSATVARLVLIDVAYHPGSAISEITERTGYHQSQISSAVAKLRELGVLETEPDPTDRRRTLVRTAPMLEEIPRRNPISVSDVLAEELGPDGKERLTEAIAALDLLAELLIAEDDE